MITHTGAPHVACWVAAPRRDDEETDLMISFLIERDGVGERRQAPAAALTAAPGLVEPLARALDCDRRV